MNNNLTLSYRKDALQSLITLLHLPPTRISKLMGQTNNITINRWLDGKDIYTTALLNLCNMFQLDLLSFFTYDGQAFQTNLADIIRLEQSGMNLRQLLEEKGVTPCTFSESHTLSTQTPYEQRTTIGTLLPKSQPSEKAAETNLPTALLDRIIAIQCKSHEHEMQMLEQQRTDLQSIINDKDKQIAALQKELNRLRKEKSATIQHFGGMVADDSEAGNK